MNDTSPSRLALLALVGFGVVLALAVAELAARILPAPDSFATRMTAFRDAILQPDAALGWRPTPSAQTTIGGIAYHFDDLGCRDQPQPGDARPKLLIAGDSMALGWGVAEEDTFAGRIARARPELDVRNAGVVGYNVTQSVARVAQLLPLLHPQRVLLTFFANDAEPLGGPAPLLARSALWRRLRPALWPLADDVTAYHARLNALGSPGWQRVTDGLTQFGELCKKNQIKCIVALIPELQKQPYGLADLHARVAALARAQGLEVVDLAPAIADVPPQKLWVAPDDAHPNAEGNQRFAERLLRAL